ncbi:hypothetical protein BM1_04359 [Bipolaris maydis]|nr:hypothetical protein BM1_04359 [Bipolaris maydis]
MAVEGVPKFVVDESADTDRREQESDETKARLDERTTGQWAMGSNLNLDPSGRFVFFAIGTTRYTVLPLVPATIPGSSSAATSIL